jgi:hypothetical protein
MSDPKPYKPHVHKGQRELPPEEQKIEILIGEKNAKEAFEAYKTAQAKGKVCHRIMAAVLDLIKNEPSLTEETKALTEALAKVDDDRARRGRPPR